MYPMYSQQALSSVIELTCYFSTLLAAVITYLQLARG